MSIRPISKARAKQMREYRKLKAEYLAANPLCEVHRLIWMEDRNPPSKDVHHSRGRIGSLLVETKWWFAVCRCCHQFIGAHPKRARELGLITDAGGWNTTSKTKHRRRE